MKIIVLFLTLFQSIQIPIDYFFNASESVIHVLHDDKIERYKVDNGYQLISSTPIKNSNLYQLSNFKFLNEHVLTSKFGGKVLQIRGDSIFRIDNSYDHRMQMGSLEFDMNDTIIRYGGYGFFENRNFFTYYENITNEWEVLEIKGDIVPERLSNYEFQLSDNKLIIFGGYEHDRVKKDVIYENLKCYSFDFKTKKWTIIGYLNQHIKRNGNSFLYDDYTLIVFHKGMVLKVNPALNLNKEYYPNPITREIENSFFRPFTHNGQIYLSNLENGKLKFKTISLEIFDSSLILKNTGHFFKTSYWVSLLFLILIIISIIIIILLTKRYLNKIVKINGLYFYNLKKVKLKGHEKILFNTLYEHSKKNYKVENRVITEIFFDENLNYATINRRKNEGVNKLNDKLKIIFKTNKDVIIREYSDIDKREIHYLINPKFN